MFGKGLAFLAFFGFGYFAESLSMFGHSICEFAQTFRMGSDMFRHPLDTIAQTVGDLFGFLSRFRGVGSALGNALYLSERL